MAILLLTIFVVACTETKEIRNGVIAIKTDQFGATYSFKASNGSYSYTILHRDGSGGTYALRKSGNKYYDITSRFGEYYMINSGNIYVYNDNGLIKTM